GDCSEKRQRLDDRKVRLDAEQDMIPHPKRVEAEMLHSHSVLDQRFDVRHLRIGGEIWHRGAECPIQTSHHKLLCCRTAYVEVATRCRAVRDRARARARVPDPSAARSPPGGARTPREILCCPEALPD